MALIKIVTVGDKLTFDLRDKKKEADRIVVYLSEKAGRRAVLRIEADRSIPIIHDKLITLP